MGPVLKKYALYNIYTWILGPPPAKKTSTIRKNKVGRIVDAINYYISSTKLMLFIHQAALQDLPWAN